MKDIDIEERKKMIEYKESGSTIELLFQDVLLHAGTGNTTWILEAAKINPDCEILFGSRVLADYYRREYAEWFKKKNQRLPGPSEIPCFLYLGGLIHHSNRGLRVPLVIDNSCLDTRLLKEHNYKIYNDGYNTAETKYARVLTAKDILIADIIKVVETARFIPFKKRLLAEIYKLKLDE